MSTTFSIREVYNNTANTVNVLIGEESTALKFSTLSDLGLKPEQVCGMMASRTRTLNTVYLMVCQDGKGNVILRRDAQASQELNLHYLSPGVYWLRVVSEDGPPETFKLLKL